MNHLVFSEQPDYPIVFLVPSISKDGILKEYITPFGLLTDDIAVITLHQSQTKKKTPVAEMKEYIQSELMGVLENLQAKYVLVADTEYFKVLTGTAKADVNLGYVLPSVFGSFNVIYIPSYKAVFYDPIKIRPKIKQSVEALLAHISNDYSDPGKDIIKFAAYPRTNEEIAVWIDKLLAMDCDLTIDIEAFSLKHNTAGIGSITFCWNQNEGVSFLVDYEPIEGATCAPYGKQVINNPVRAMLIYFFRNFKRKAIYHHISYDVYVLIYQLFMTEILDTEGLLYGLDTMLANWEDTKLITYLATNSCAGNKLSLKDQAQAYAGNYAQEEINDITKIPPDQLLKYNLVDGLSTWYVHDKYYQKMIDDQQLDIYSNVFKPAIVDIIQMQLTGLPLNMKRVKEVKVILEADRDSATTRIQANPIIQQYIYQKNEDWVIEKNNTLKKKRVTIDDAKEEFNPGSGQQLQEVLFKQLGLPVIDLTKSKQPSTGKDTLKALKHHTTDPNVISLLNALIDFSDVDIILTTFITSMENAALGSDGWHYLFGNFNLGGTVSGRLSCVAPWTQVKTQTGLKKIVDLIPGDSVWTHKRRWKPVIALIKKPLEEMFDIHFCNGYTLTCTKSHKLNVPNRGWLTIEEIINERIKIVDAEPSKYRQCCKSVSNYRFNNRAGSETTSNNYAQRFSCFKPTFIKRRVESTSSSKVFNLQRGRKEPNEGEIWRATSQLRWGVQRWLRIPNSNKKRKATVCTQSSNGRVLRNSGVTRKFRCSPYRRKSTQQLHRQFGPMYQNWTPKNTWINGNVCFGKIQKINYSGVTQVWDITVEDDESYWAEGCFNHNSSKPNLQNLPSTGSKYAKVIKSCFQAPPGWLFCGLDFASLEDRISALSTKDKNKIRVYTDGFDGHSLRAFAYYREKMPDIVDTVESINSIQTVYKNFRQISKEPTFLLTYGGTYRGLMKNCGFPEDEAKMIEKRYHDLYQESDKWVQDRLTEASQTGYVEVAFGLRVRTPLLHQVIRGLKRTPYEAEAEGRTAGNALGQSWCLLNSRAASEFMGKVRPSRYRLDIRPCAHIHDAQYYLIRDNIDTILYTNQHLVKAVQWQEDPLIQHDEVKLGGELSIFWPDWSKELTIPNNVSENKLLSLVQTHIAA